MDHRRTYFNDLKCGDMLAWYYRDSENENAEILLFILKNDDMTVFFNLTDKRFSKFYYRTYLTGGIIAGMED